MREIRSGGAGWIRGACGCRAPWIMRSGCDQWINGVDPWIMRAPHQRLVRHILTVAVLVLDAKARRALVLDDLALESALPCAAQGGSRDQKRCLGLRCGRFQKLRSCKRTLERLRHGKVDVGRRITSSVSILGTALHRCFGPYALRADRFDPTARLLGAPPLLAQTVCAVRRPAARLLTQRAIRPRFLAGLLGERRAQGARGGHRVGLDTLSGAEHLGSRALALRCARVALRVGGVGGVEIHIAAAVFVLVATEKWPARSWAKRGGILYDCVNTKHHFDRSNRPAKQRPD
mgnify:CR=1 FL=1